MSVFTEVVQAQSARIKIHDSPSDMPDDVLAAIGNCPECGTQQWLTFDDQQQWLEELRETNTLGQFTNRICSTDGYCLARAHVARWATRPPWHLPYNECLMTLRGVMAHLPAYTEFDMVAACASVRFEVRKVIWDAQSAHPTVAALLSEEFG